MKIALSADLHLNSSQYGEDIKTGRSWRSDDFKAAFGKVVDRVIEHDKPDLFIVAGDVYEHPSPDNNSRKFFAAQVRRLSDAGIVTRILVGNHDVNSSGHPLLEMVESKIPNVFIDQECTAVEDDSCLYLIMPHTPAVEGKLLSMRQQYLDFIKEQAAAISKAKKANKQVVFLGHFDVFGAKMNDGFVNMSKESVTLDDLTLSQADYIFLGHYHGHQKLSVDDVSGAYFIGSLERSNIFDIESDKGYMIYDTSKPPAKRASFVSAAKLIRPMYDVEGGVDLIDKLSAMKDKVKDAIVRIHFVGTVDELKSLGEGLIDAKRVFEEECGAKHVYLKVDAVDPEREKRAQAVLAEIDKMGSSLEERDTENVVRINVENSTYDDDEKAAIITLASDIINSVKNNEE